MVVIGVAVLGKDVRAAPPLCTPHVLPRPRALARNPVPARRQRPALPPACAAGQKLCHAILPSLSKLGSRAQNNPLYIKAYGQHDQLRFHFIVHTSLDFLEEKVAAQTQGSASIPTAATSKHDSYLGLLYPIEELRVYGYLTNCRIKLLAVLDDDEVKDAEMKALFRRLHALYVDTTSNPFHSPDTELMSIQSFDRQVQRIVSAGLY
jgi:hypothetical protein